jgi:hypothetical protein
LWIQSPIVFINQSFWCKFAPRRLFCLFVQCSVPLHSLEHVRNIPNIRKKYTLAVFKVLPSLLQRLRNIQQPQHVVGGFAFVY